MVHGGILQQSSDFDLDLPAQHTRCSDLFILVNFYNLLLSGCKVEALHFGDFFGDLLPKKRPHGVVVNGRPLSNLSVPWKLFSMVITKALQSWLVCHGRISRTGMAVQRSTSVVDLLRVVFD